MEVSARHGSCSFALCKSTPTFTPPSLSMMTVSAFGSSVAHGYTVAVLVGSN